MRSCRSQSCGHPEITPEPPNSAERRTEAFSEFLTETRYSATEIRFIQLIVDELTANGVVPASRLYEPPFTDHAPTGPDMLFPGADGDRLFVILDEVCNTARPDVGVA